MDGCKPFGFVPAENKIYVDAYSPTLDKHNTAPEHSYVIEHNLLDKREPAETNNGLSLAVIA